MTAPGVQQPVPAVVWDDVLAAVDVAGAYGMAEPEELAAALYSDWYLGSSQVADTEPANAPNALELNLAGMLREAHVDAGRWLAGWTVAGVSTRGRVVVTKNGARRIVARVDVLPAERTCLPPRPGDAVRVAARRDALDAEGGFWFTYGGDWNEAELPPELIRVYWHVRRRSAPALVQALTGRLALAGCDYALKIAVEDRQAERPDRAVLYLAEDALAAATGAIRDVYVQLEGQLSARVPRLTLRLGGGLAMAEDPGTGESFGQHCCRLMAEAIAAAGQDAVEPARLAAAVCERLAAVGLDPERPYLRPGKERARWLWS